MRGSDFIKIVDVYVNALGTHAEKRQVWEGFEVLGWSVAPHFVASKDIFNPNPTLVYLECTWWENINPPYPHFPAECRIIDRS